MNKDIQKVYNQNLVLQNIMELILAWDPIIGNAD